MAPLRLRREVLRLLVAVAVLDELLELELRAADLVERRLLLAVALTVALRAGLLVDLRAGRLRVLARALTSWSLQSTLNHLYLVV